MRIPWCGLLLALIGTFAGCQKPPQTVAPASVTVTARQSDKADRRGVGVTIYNQNFGLVRDSRRVRLDRGRVELAFEDVPAHIQPESVRLHGATAGARLQVLEQNYRYDLLTPSKLLEKYVGRTISVYRYDPKTGTEAKKSAEVLGVEGGVTLRIDGEVTSDFQGRFAFDAVPPNLLQKPTLVWLLDSDRAEQDVEVSYLTQNLNWRADYVLELDASESRANLTGWVTLENRSGTSYENAALRLVAGDVNRAPAAEIMPMDAVSDSAQASSTSSAFREQGLFEYHLYTLDRPTTLLDRETKQVSLLSAEGVVISKRLVSSGDAGIYRQRYPEPLRNQKVSVFVELENRERNRLGLPLPRGTVRLYQADAAGAPQFLGEDSIEHTPRDETLRLKVGEAFDVLAERVQKEFTQLDRCLAESAFEIELRNHKSSDVEVTVNEPVGGDWEVREHDQPFVKVDQGTLRFDVKVPARSSSKISYRIVVRSC